MGMREWGPPGLSSSCWLGDFLAGIVVPEKEYR